MMLTNEEIKDVLDDAPEHATEIYRDEYVSGGNFTEGYIQHGLYVKQRHSLSDLAEILALRERVEQQQDTIDKLLTLLNAADCPCCDKSGGYHDGYGLVQQCQWCDELNKLKENTNERD